MGEKLPSKPTFKILRRLSQQDDIFGEAISTLMRHLMISPAFLALHNPTPPPIINSLVPSAALSHGALHFPLLSRRLLSQVLIKRAVRTNVFSPPHFIATVKRVQPQREQKALTLLHPLRVAEPGMMCSQLDRGRQHSVDSRNNGI